MATWPKMGPCCLVVDLSSSLQVSHLSVYQGSERQVVKQICEVLPNIGVAILPETFVVEAVHLCDLSRLMVSTQDGDSLLKTHLVGWGKKDS